MGWKKRNQHNDANHVEIREGLRSHGVSVVDTASAPGFVDLVACRGGVNYMIEVKPPGWTKPRNANEKTQQAFRVWWRHTGGQVVVVTSLAEALTALGIH